MDFFFFFLKIAQSRLMCVRCLQLHLLCSCCGQAFCTAIFHSQFFELAVRLDCNATKRNGSNETKYQFRAIQSWKQLSCCKHLFFHASQLCCNVKKKKKTKRYEMKITNFTCAAWSQRSILIRNIFTTDSLSPLTTLCLHFNAKHLILRNFTLAPIDSDTWNALRRLIKFMFFFRRKQKFSFSVFCCREVSSSDCRWHVNCAFVKWQIPTVKTIFGPKRVSDETRIEFSCGEPIFNGFFEMEISSLDELITARELKFSCACILFKARDAVCLRDAPLPMTLLHQNTHRIDCLCGPCTWTTIDFIHVFTFAIVVAVNSIYSLSSCIFIYCNFFFTGQ